MKKVLDHIMAHGGSIWLLENEISNHFDRQELACARYRGLVKITSDKAPAVRIEVTFKGRRYLENPGRLQRFRLFITGLFTHRLDE